MPQGAWETPELGDAPDAMKTEAKTIYASCRDANPAETPEAKGKCARIMWAALGQRWEKNPEGKWVKKEWMNDRTFIAPVSSESEDLQGEVVLRKAIEAAMPLYLAFGNLTYAHTNWVIGRPLDMWFEGDLTMAKFGIYSHAPSYDRVWKEIQACDDSCGTSIGGEALARIMRCTPESGCTSTIPALELYEIAWLPRGTPPANPQAMVSEVSMAKCIDGPGRKGYERAAELYIAVKWPIAKLLAECRFCADFVEHLASKGMGQEEALEILACVLAKCYTALHPVITVQPQAASPPGETPGTETENMSEEVKKADAPPAPPAVSGVEATLKALGEGMQVLMKKVGDIETAQASRMAAIEKTMAREPAAESQAQPVMETPSSDMTERIRKLALMTPTDAARAYESGEW